MGNRTKNRVISIRVTQEVYDEIHAMADASGESLESFLPVRLSEKRSFSSRI